MDFGEGGFALQYLQELTARKGIRWINGVYFFHFFRLAERGRADLDTSDKAKSLQAIDIGIVVSMCENLRSSTVYASWKPSCMFPSIGVV